MPNFSATQWPPLSYPAPTPETVSFQPEAPPVPPSAAPAVLNEPPPFPLVQTASGLLLSKRRVVTTQEATWALFGIVNGTNTGI